jgi:two-component system response regulator
MSNDVIEILLVEDNMDDAEMTIRALKKVNIANKLMHLEDGEETLDFLFAKGKFKNRSLTNKPKLILLDIKMPKVDGLEVLRQLKSNETTRNIPVIIMTSSGDDMDMIDSYNLGVNGYLVKPVNFENFAKSIVELGYYWSLINHAPHY